MLCYKIRTMTNNYGAETRESVLANVGEGTGQSEFELSYCGWRVVAAACFGVMASFGSLFVYTFAVFVKPLGAAFGWSREGVSLGFALAAIVGSLTAAVLYHLRQRRAAPKLVIFQAGAAMAVLALVVGYGIYNGASWASFQRRVLDEVGREETARLGELRKRVGSAGEDRGVPADQVGLAADDKLVALADRTGP